MTTAEITKAIGEIGHKYHLTPRQWIQVRQIVWDVAQGKNVLYVAPRKAGLTTVYKASNEIIKALGLQTSKLKNYHDAR